MRPYGQLLEHNIKPSTQRIAITEYLVNHPIHPSANDIYTTLSPSILILSKITVYNTLRSSSERGATLMFMTDKENINFSADTSVHSHSLCRYCGHTYNLKSSGTVKKIESLEMGGHQVAEVHCYYKGICENYLRKDRETRTD